MIAQKKTSKEKILIIGVSAISGTVIASIGLAFSMFFTGIVVGLSAFSIGLAIAVNEKSRRRLVFDIASTTFLILTFPVSAGIGIGLFDHQNTQDWKKEINRISDNPNHLKENIALLKSSIESGQFKVLGTYESRYASWVSGDAPAEFLMHVGARLAAPYILPDRDLNAQFPALKALFPAKKVFMTNTAFNDSETGLKEALVLSCIFDTDGSVVHAHFLPAMMFVDETRIPEAKGLAHACKGVLTHAYRSQTETSEAS